MSGTPEVYRLPSPDPQTDLRVLVLELVGEFAKTQELVDGLIHTYFQKRTPGMLDYLKQRRVISKIVDDDRPMLTLTLAEELQTVADLTNFSTVYRRVKRVRDYAGHSSRIDVIGPDTLQLTKQFLTGFGEKPAPPMVVTREELIARICDARWLAQHVQFILATGGLTKMIYLGDRKIEFVEPPATPESWDGTQFVFVNS
ncbi:hypothetical protein [Nocardia niwae]|uniref:HEPN AbiU2-like domain-containing protein n=1 Tax=Nocardia niwae TaxID=626084 RepID=A0ABV2X4I6_9NOCA